MDPDVLASLRALPGAAVVLDALAGREDVWVVGGAVRDALLGRTPRDLDLVVEGDALALARELGEVVEVHERFGTAEARVEGLAVGVAGARTETYAAPGALPDVQPGTLEEDLARRDFTVNAVAVGMDGELRGAGEWRADLEAGRLRVLHERSFLDDPTRLWRAARYAARLGFGLEEATERLAKQAVAAGAPATVTGPRLGNELLLALGEPDPAAALAAAYELGLLPAGAHPRRAVVRAALALLPEDGTEGLTVLAAMSGAVAPERLRAWLDDLAVPARERDVVVEAVRGAEGLAARLGAATRPSEIAAVARGRAVEELALAGAVGGGAERAAEGGAEAAAEGGPEGAAEGGPEGAKRGAEDGAEGTREGGAEAAARAWLGELRHVRLDIDGRDLLAAGVPEGPEVGERLARALDARLDGEAPDRERQLAVALA
jgi:tRNA nucleotidyltransferase (CCA-adding enzyme)